MHSPSSSTTSSNTIGHVDRAELLVALFGSFKLSLLVIELGLAHDS